MTPEPAKVTGPAQASFEGHLKLDAFRYKGVLRRSSREKRKAIEEPEVTPLAGGNLQAPRPGEDTSLRPTKKPRAAGKPRTVGKPPATATAPPASSPAASNKPARKAKAAYSPPSQYAHLGLAPLPDAIGPNLLVLFVGYNPGEETARQGHAYASPSNRFWPFLALSGLTPGRIRPAEDQSLPARFSLGLTNLVDRPTKTAAELSTEELCEGVETVQEKVRRWRPEVVCFAGKGIWEAVWLVKHGKKMTKKDFKYGFQDEAQNFGVVPSNSQEAILVEEGVTSDPNWAGAKVFVATTTSGLATLPTKAEKEENWKELGAWVAKRRVEREESKTS